MDKQRSAPENQSRKYTYIPKIEDYMYVYKKYLSRTSSIRWSIIQSALIHLCIWASVWLWMRFLGSFSGDASIQDLIDVVCVFSNPVFLIRGLTYQRTLYRRSINTLMESDVRYSAARTVSFDGYHLVLESQYFITMTVISKDDTITLTNQGLMIHVKKQGNYIYLPAQIFKKMREMYDFYDRLTWNERYEKIYR